MSQVFSFYLSKGAGSTGKLKFGGYDLNSYAKPGTTDQDIVWTQVVDDGWTIPMSGLQFLDGQKIDIKSEQITMDTGLSYALVPPRDIDDIVRALKEQNGNFTCKKAGADDLDMYQCKCDENVYKKLKPLQIKIGQKFFTLPVSAWMSFDNSQDDNAKCKILMHPYDISMTATYKWVIGVQFLQNFYSIFDVQNKKVGLVESKDASI